MSPPRSRRQDLPASQRQPDEAGIAVALGLDQRGATTGILDALDGLLELVDRRTFWLFDLEDGVTHGEALLGRGDAGSTSWISRPSPSEFGTRVMPTLVSSGRPGFRLGRLFDRGDLGVVELAERYRRFLLLAVAPQIELDLVPGSLPAMVRLRSSAFLMSSPSTLTITSPDLMPALSAGPPWSAR
jgi:hypothetical protein